MDDKNETGAPSTDRQDPSPNTAQEQKVANPNVQENAGREAEGLTKEDDEDLTEDD